MNTKEESISKALIRFAIPYMIAAFLQTLYGLVDLFVVGKFNTAATTTAVSIGSQIMHMVTVVILGLVLGITVCVGNAYGAKDNEGIRKVIGTAIAFFSIVAIVFTILLVISNHGFVRFVLTPKEAVSQTRQYLLICSLGVPFIFAFNMISGIFRGLGDSKNPMYAVVSACGVNVFLDFVFVGGCGLGARGAALATVIGQLTSCIVVYFLYTKRNPEYRIKLKEIKLEKEVLKKVIFVGIPVALQDGFIQVAFLVITVIANARGLVDSAAVGVVEKMICFFFLVPSAFMSAISALTAQYTGAGSLNKAKASLKLGLLITVIWGAFIILLSQVAAVPMVSIFTGDELVRNAGAIYLHAYSIDTLFAAIHFCFSGYFCGVQKSYISFLHNLISVLVIRIPGSYFASKLFPNTLFPMGLAAPLGSLVSALICVAFFMYYNKKDKESIVTDKN